MRVIKRCHFEIIRSYINTVVTTFPFFPTFHIQFLKDQQCAIPLYGGISLSKTGLNKK